MSQNKENGVPLSQNLKHWPLMYHFPEGKPIFWGPGQASTLGQAYEPPPRDAWIRNHVLQIPRVARFFFGDGGPVDDDDDDLDVECWFTLYSAATTVPDPGGSGPVFIIDGVPTPTAEYGFSIWLSKTGSMVMCGPKKSNVPPYSAGYTFVYSIGTFDGETPCEYTGLVGCYSGVDLGGPPPTVDQIDQANAMINGIQSAWDTAAPDSPNPEYIPGGSVDYPNPNP